MRMAERIEFTVNLRNQTRRFTLSTQEATWPTLCVILRATFNLQDNDDIVLFYRDNDRDLITLSSELELSELLGQAESGVVNLYDRPWENMAWVFAPQQSTLDYSGEPQLSQTSGYKFEKANLADDERTVRRDISSDPHIGASTSFNVNPVHTNYAAAFEQFGQVLDNHQGLVYSDPEIMRKLSHMFTQILLTGETTHLLSLDMWLLSLEQQKVEQEMALYASMSPDPAFDHPERWMSPPLPVSQEDMREPPRYEEHTLGMASDNQQSFPFWNADTCTPPAMPRLPMVPPPPPMPSAPMLPPGPMAPPPPLIQAPPFHSRSHAAEPLLSRMMKTMGSFMAGPSHPPSDYPPRYYSPPIRHHGHHHPHHHHRHHHRAHPNDSHHGPPPLHPSWTKIPIRTPLEHHQALKEEHMELKRQARQIKKEMRRMRRDSRRERRAKKKQQERMKRKGKAAATDGYESSSSTSSSSTCTSTCSSSSSSSSSSKGSNQVNALSHKVKDLNFK